MLLPHSSGRRRRAPVPTTPDPLPLRSGPELFVGHPLHRRDVVRLGDEEVLIRPVLPMDAMAIDRLVRSLSLESRVRRFHAALRRLTPAQLAGIVDVDHRERETLVAVLDRPRAHVVGLAQYVSTGPATAEPALLVADDWQGRGLGGHLARRLTTAAREAGVDRFEARVLADNVPVLRLAEHNDRARIAPVDRDSVELTLPLRRAPGSRVGPCVPVAGPG